jgi:hypothetical protein
MSKKTKVTFMLDDDLYQWVQDRAAQKRSTVTQVVKELIIHGIMIEEKSDEILKQLKLKDDSFSKQERA